MKLVSISNILFIITTELYIYIYIRVQRVPATESKGRIHSSTAVIVVMPIISKEYTLEMKDVRIDTYRASGPGGQHVNTTDSAVRALHKPTGIMATNQDERTQHDNKKVALKVTNYIYIYI